MVGFIAVHPLVGVRWPSTLRAQQLRRSVLSGRWRAPYRRAHVLKRLWLQSKSSSEANPSGPANIEEDPGDNEAGSVGTRGPEGSNGGLDVSRLSAALYRLGAAAWWAQLLLSIVAGGITLFAVAILHGSRGVSGATTTAASTGLLFAGIGLVFAFLSVFWAYGYIRLARRLMRAQKMGYGVRSENVFRTLRVGVFINILGMALTLIGAQSISGVLLAKALSQGVAGPLPFYATGSIQAGGGTVGYVQALDIFVVQANTNALLSHFVGLCTALWMLWRFRGPQRRRAA
ncbi:hypothetical protein CCYA_CCYA08G2400 [Cyanidiococcus yangmingshanensis]|nr:hypothetical protein CCYA_CCYA08G2400 [Cyanidiococcus yangmingshanensis]